MIYDVVVVGAGPAGLFAAIGAAGAGARVLVLERMGSPGRKLLVSGSGQCNVTHSGPIAAFLDRYGGAGKFLRPALYGFSNEDLGTFLADRGVPLEETESGKIFPVSRRARDVLDALTGECRRLGADIRTDSRVSAVSRGDGGFRVETDGCAEAAKALVIATGGRSYPKTGSSGDGYALAVSLGHRIVETAPALTPVVAEVSGGGDFAPFAACAGVSLSAAGVLAYRAGRKTASGRGDVLFTHRGLSGPAVLDLSRDIRVGDELRIQPDPDAPEEAETDRRLLAALNEHGKRGVVRVLREFGLPESLARAVLASRGLDPDLKASSLGREARRVLSGALSGGGAGGFRFRAAALGGWDEAMATRGGVDLAEINPRTMRSRLVPGLFFAGEVLDIDGDTGGFNIQAACSTGILAGKSALE